MYSSHSLPHRNTNMTGSQNLIPPPANWKPELTGTMRTWTWKRAAGFNEDGSCKSKGANTKARSRIVRTELLRVTHMKDESELTPEDHIVLGKEKLYKTSSSFRTNKYLGTPCGKEKNHLINVVMRKRLQDKRAARADNFIDENEIDIDTGTLSDQDAFNHILTVFDDKDSPMGKDLFDALGGMTLRESFWDGKFDGAMYALSSRGAADIGRAKSEAVRFLTCNYQNAPVLVRGSDGKRFKYGDKEFKNLELVYCPIWMGSTYASCTTVESAFQLLFDFLVIGQHRLWLKSGVGRSKLTLRKCDMKYIEGSGGKPPKFMVGLSIIKNISVVERETNPNGRDVVLSITAGLGVACQVNQPRRAAPLCNESQREALVTAQKTLGPNFMDGSLKRKSDAIEE